MKTASKVALGLLATGGALWGTRAWIRSRRRIDYAGRVVVITGSSTGLGFLLAQQVAAQGAHVVLNARGEDNLLAAEQELQAQGAPELLGVVADVGVEEQAQALIEQALAHFGQIDFLINNAAKILVGPEATMTLEDYQRLMATNFWGAVYPTLAVLPSMRERGFGRIGNIMSIGGLASAPHLSPYCASKFALAGFTRSLRTDLARHGILVTGAYPKTIRTGGHTHAWFKGDAQAEYLWFAATDTLPLISASAERTAAKILDALKHGDSDLIPGLVARMAIAFDALAPNWSAELKALIERGMPGPTNLGAPPIQGSEIQGRLAEMFTRMVPESARPG